ncbi:MAG: response regulator [Syntrophorhabdaceae bacterium]
MITKSGIFPIAYCGVRVYFKSFQVEISTIDLRERVTGYMTREHAKDRILVVDDDELISEMVSEMLHRMGYLPVAYNSPTDALGLFSRSPERFDAVIVDEIMPGMRGTELAAKLLEIKEDIPIILITGHGDMTSLEKIRKSGVRATLIKPLRRDWFEHTLDKLLKKRKQES